MKKSTTLIWHYIRAIYQIIINAGFVIAFLLLGLYVLTQVPQSQDLLRQYMDIPGWTWQLTYLYAAIFLSCYVTQACLNIVLFNANGIDDVEIAKPIAKWLPFVVAQLPFIALVLLIKDYREIGVVLSVIGAYLVFFSLNFYKLYQWDNGWLASLWNKTNSIRYDFKALFSYWQYRIFFSIIGGVTLLCGILFIALPVQSGAAVAVGAPAVLVLGLSVIITFFSLILFVGVPGRRPAFIFFILYVWLVSYGNPNKDVRQSAAPSHGVEPVKDFENWVKDRKAKDLTKDSTLHVVLVATEGGGIRATVHTMLTLLKCNEKNANFDRHLYAISGVSGGGVGATFYTAFQHDRQQNPRLTTDKLKQFCYGDFVSDVVGGLLFSDALNSILPVGVSSFDRNKKLEDAWATAYQAKTNSNTLGKDFTQLWQPTDSSRNYNLPVLMLNGTLAETGQRIITSNLNLKSTPNNFADIVFTFQKRRHDVPVKTAALLCARFPLVSSGGLLKDNEGRRVGHVTDGGYFENTGLETIVHWLNLIGPHLPRIQKNQKIKLKFHLLFLQNSATKDSEGTDFKIDSTSTQKVKEAKRLSFSTYSTIFKSFLNPWSRGTTTRNNLYKTMLIQRKDMEVSYYHFKLKRYLKEDRPTDPNFPNDYPLGWFMSEALVRQMDKDLAIDTTFTNLSVAMK
jgi:hypothetical protein